MKFREQIRNIPRAEGNNNKLWNIECLKLKEERSKYQECSPHQIGGTPAEEGGFMSVERKWTDINCIMTETARVGVKKETGSHAILGLRANVGK